VASSTTDGVAWPSLPVRELPELGFPTHLPLRRRRHHASRLDVLRRGRSASLGCLAREGAEGASGVGCRAPTQPSGSLPHPHRHQSCPRDRSLAGSPRSRRAPSLVLRRQKPRSGT
jgi:hypothetical protein